jgi:hypothetical protein
MTNNRLRIKPLLWIAMSWLVLSMNTACVKRIPIESSEEYILVRKTDVMQWNKALRKCSEHLK